MGLAGHRSPPFSRSPSPSQQRPYWPGLACTGRGTGSGRPGAGAHHRQFDVHVPEWLAFARLHAARKAAAPPLVGETCGPVSFLSSSPVARDPRVGRVVSFFYLCQPRPLCIQRTAQSHSSSSSSRGPPSRADLTVHLRSPRSILRTPPPLPPPPFSHLSSTPPPPPPSAPQSLAPPSKSLH